VPEEPSIKRVIAFFDGQNLFHAAREAFGYTYPNYDPTELAQAIANAQGWQLKQVRFYTGVPDAQDDTKWHAFWTAKASQLGRRGVKVYTRPLRYRNRTILLPDGKQHTYLAGHEKGIDIRIALDVVGLALRGSYEVALLFSQDQDLSEVADEIRGIARETQRWLQIASAYPVSPTCTNRRGINSTDWIRIDRATYDACLDPRDYRPKTP
jgi:uncharacterized LabA/DUF88 family protein